MEEFVSVPAIVVICYLIGLICKTIPKIKNEVIPLAVGVSGLILGIVAMYVAPELIPAKDVFSAAAIGVASGLASTGINQIGKQIRQLAIQSTTTADADKVEKIDPVDDPSTADFNADSRGDD